jgi:hypothetical protein
MKRLLAFLIVGMALNLNAQETRQPSGRRIPALATETPTITPTITPTPTVTPTITPTPDPCADCPPPESPVCQMWPLMCFQCWEDCGQPIATHTPTPIPTATRTPTPPPTPTPQGPACALPLPSGGTIYLVAFYEHESDAQGTRYSFQTAPVWVAPGSTARPCPCEGYPVGFQWYTSDGVLLKSCGDVTTKHWHLFSDGFETGDVSKWMVEDE